MASLRALAERRAIAVQRLDDIKQRLAKDYGVATEEQVVTNRDAELAQIQTLENVAAALESAEAGFKVKIAELQDEIEALKEAAAEAAKKHKPAK